MTLLTQKQLAEIMNISPATVARRTKEGSVPCVTTAFGIRYRLSEITQRPEDLDIDDQRGRVRTKLLAAKDCIDALLEEV